MNANGKEVVAATSALALLEATRTHSPTSCSAAPSYACDCCLVWEIIRGPHAGERAVFSALDSEETTTLLRIGRQSQCWLRLKKDLEVSGIHAELSVVHTPSLTLRLCDAKSTNGTKINGQTAEKRVEYEVKHQDLVQFGRSTVRVSRGDTRCPRAWNGGGGGGGELTEEVKTEKVANGKKKEPAEEPEPKVKKTQTEADETLAQTSAATEERTIADAWAERDEHGDANAFEEPPARSPSVSSSVSRSELVPAPVAGVAVSRSRVLEPQLSVCMVCGLELSAWGILEQQLHVNACLDKGTGRPSSASGGERPKGGGGGAPTRAAATGTKRKRGRQTTLHPQDEQLAVALALSKSLVGKEQQVDMDMALVAGELAQVDAQLTKLQKKRVALIKKLEKLEKNKRKVQKGDVRSPEETKALLDLSWALRVLFPERRQVGIQEEEGRHDTTRRQSRLVELYRGSEATTVQLSGEEYVAMWLRASQSPSVGCETEHEKENEDKLYTNQLMRELLARAEQPTARSDAPVDDPSAKAESLENEMETDTLPVDSEMLAVEVPDVVKRVFPQWAENLAFLKTQSVEDLESALEELQQMRMERKMDKAKEGEGGGGRGGERDEGGRDAVLGGEGDGPNTDGEDDEEVACAFFEQEMMRLITERHCQSSSRQNDSNHDNVIDADVEIVELMDSSDDDDVGNDGGERDLQSSDDDPECSTAAPTAYASASTPPVAATDSASDLSAEEDGSRLLSDGEKSYLSDGNRTAVDESEPLVATTPSTGVEPKRPESPQPDRLVAQHETPTTANYCADKERLETVDEFVAPLEQQLLDALKANATLYEAVLLLQPLDLQQLLHYIRHEAKIKCAKAVLVRFCDRHGITFKQS